MRDKINNDPKMQIGIVAVLVVLAAFFFISKSGGESEEEPAAEATVAVAGTEATGTATGATTGEAVEGAVEEAVATASTEAVAAPATPTAIQAPPLPKPVREAYKANQTVVLLVVHDGGIDDDLVAKSVKTLSSLEDVATFVVPASQIYRYASITIGVEVTQVPALVVMRPRKLSGGVEQASVTFGFRSQASVEQAVRNAQYKGPADTYHPN